VHGPAPAGRPRFDIADIVRRHRAALEAEQDLTLAQCRVLSDIDRCRTVALGGHLDVCRSCGIEEPAYNSCRNRHCPKCQALAQERWIAARAERLLPSAHFHAVFTLPSELRALARFKPKAIFDALFHAASETLLELGRSRFGAELGVTMVLHTWKRDLGFHPHVHAIVTAGGLAHDGERWIDSRKRYLFPVEVMRALVRGKMIDALRCLHRRNSFDGFDDPHAFERLIDKIARKNWVVYVKEPFRRVEHVLEYLGRYTHRVAIANSRLVDVTGQRVTFRTKHGKTVSLAPVEFLWRFVQHVLPPRFVKIRHYGLYAASHVDGNLETARQLLDSRVNRRAAPTATASWADLLLDLTGRDVRRCSVCNGELARIPLQSRAPPSVAA
jgi:hypothetical protein